MLDHVTAIVLAGGRSSRFGTDKLAFELEGRAMLDHAIAAVAAVAPRIVLVLAPGAVTPATTLDAARLEIVHDPTAFDGPLAGLAAALASVRTPVALVVGGDMPRMVPAVLQRLASTINGDRTATNLEVPRRVQPLPMALSVDHARPVVVALLARGERSLRSLLAEVGAASLPAPVWLSLDPAGATILDVNRPSDLHR